MFFPENCGFTGKKKRQIDEKLKTQLVTFQYRYTPHVLSEKSFAQYIRLQLKNATALAEMSKPEGYKGMRVLEYQGSGRFGIRVLGNKDIRV